MNPFKAIGKTLATIVWVTRSSVGYMVLPPQLRRILQTGIAAVETQNLFNKYTEAVSTGDVSTQDQVQAELEELGWTPIGDA